ncbi:MAG: N-acyl homoserine lactonase family protein [Alicyclobacillus sp.]|nr:N-acyl homoserine lactonase family protein [Alicyclobacillus sp.]
MKYKIRPIQVGVFPSFEKSIFVLGVDPGTKIQAPCIAWLLEGENGKKILIDTGPHAPDAPTACFHNRIERSDVLRIDQALRKEGVDPAEIDIVIFTHLHWDHCHNAELLPNAVFYVQKKELAYAMDPIEWHFGSYEAKIKSILPPWFAVFDRLRTVDGDVEVAPGVLMVLLPGHTPGSAGVAVQTYQGVFMIAGDTVPLLLNWEGNSKQRHIPSALNTNIIEYYYSFKKIETISEQVLPAHDFRAFDRHVWG